MQKIQTIEKRKTFGTQSASKYRKTKPISLFSTCYYLELRGAMMSYSCNSTLTSKSSIGCLEIIEH